MILGLTLIAIGCTVFGARASGQRRAAEPALPTKFKKLLPLHARLGKPRPGEWLAEHQEDGQTYMQYVRCRPVRPDKRRNVIYIQPIGPFTANQRKIVKLTAQFMGIYFALPVKIRQDLPLSVIPDRARRKHPSWGMDQILSTYVLDDLLRPRLPKDASALIAFTASDLWPGEGWNFVFGQASLNNRVGVWSIYRNGNPDESDASFRLCLRRTLKTATHETGHMFSMKHCTLYKCNMCGSNHRQESDSHPQALCPHCLAKLCWCMDADPQKRFQRLIAFCKDQKLDAERAFYEKSLATMRGR